MSINSAKTLVLFDIDGTLLYSNSLDSNHFAQSYEEIYGIDFPAMDWNIFPHVCDHSIFSTLIKRDFNRMPDQGEIIAFQDHFVNKLLDGRKEAPLDYKEVPGAKRAMDNLIARPDFCVGIATGGWQRPATVKLKHLGFDTSQVFDSYADDKITREDILQEAIDKAKANGNQIKRIVYIGDAGWDVKTTRKMGINFIGVRLKGDLDVLRKEGAEFVLPNFIDDDLFHSHIQEAKPPKPMPALD